MKTASTPWHWIVPLGTWAVMATAFAVWFGYKASDRDQLAAMHARAAGDVILDCNHARAIAERAASTMRPSGIHDTEEALGVALAVPVAFEHLLLRCASDQDAYQAAKEATPNPRDYASLNARYSKLLEFVPWRGVTDWGFIHKKRR